MLNTCIKTLAKCRKSKDDCNEHPRDMHALFIDDLSEAEAVNLKKQLTYVPSTRPYPLNYHERYQQILKPGSKLQANLTKIELFTKHIQMKINQEKSKIMIFNVSKNFDFPP